MAENLKTALPAFQGMITDAKNPQSDVSQGSPQPLVSVLIQIQKRVIQY